MAAKLPFNVMAFPTGPICNLDCAYCYYLNKTTLYPGNKNFMMDEELLAEYIKQYLAAHPGPRVTFGWQGGEPTLRGLDFFRKAVELQEKYKPEGWAIYNSLQTNGVMLDDEWCAFLKEHNFLVGISMDGPAWIHDYYRQDRGGQPTHQRVLRGVKLLQKYKVEYNILCVVNDLNSQHPLEVYRFFREIGANFIQFIPIVEKLPDGSVSSRTVSGSAFGRFLISVFNEWATRDLGEIFVQTFEEAARVWSGLPAALCVFGETCGRAVVMEHNGDLYACDHFVLPEYKLGNITESTIDDMMNLEKQREFGLSKRESLPAVCQECDVRFMCNGGCLRNRIVETENGRRLNYLCEGYQLFFHYIDPYLKLILKELNEGRHPAKVRESVQVMYKERWSVKRNDPCPCGSGLKYKKCCLA